MGILLIVLFPVIFGDSDKINELHLQSNITYNLRPNQYGQIMLNTFQLFKNSTFQFGTTQTTFNISIGKGQMIDIFLINNPYNSFYACYIHSFDSFQDCWELYKNICHICNETTYNPQQLSNLIQQFMAQPIKYQSQLNSSIEVTNIYENNTIYEPNTNTVCLIGCQQSIFNNSQIVINASISTMDSALAILIFDNTDFPQFGRCNYSVLNCSQSQQDSVSDPFCQEMLSVYCHQLLKSNEVDLELFYELTITPETSKQSTQLMIIGLLSIIITFLTIVLCLLWFRYKRIQKQQFALSYRTKNQ